MTSKLKGKRVLRVQMGVGRGSMDDPKAVLGGFLNIYDDFMEAFNEKTDEEK